MRILGCLTNSGFTVVALLYGAPADRLADGRVLLCRWVDYKLMDNSGGWKEANGRMAELAAASELPERPGWPRLMVQPLAQPRPDVAA